MHSSLKTCGVALALTCFAAAAGAQSLEMRRMEAAQEAKMSQKAEITNRACGTSLKTSFAWSTFQQDDVLHHEATSWCSAGLDALEDLCADPIGKQAVAAKVKSLTCAGAATPSASLDASGNLTFSFSLTPNQNKLLVRDYLDKNL